MIDIKSACLRVADQFTETSLEAITLRQAQRVIASLEAQLADREEEINRGRDILAGADTASLPRDHTLELTACARMNDLLAIREERTRLSAQLTAAEASAWRPILATLREAGWAVGCHNDYWLRGERMTFWLFTHRRYGWVKGEGQTDDEALGKALRDAEAAVLPPSPATETGT